LRTSRHKTFAPEVLFETVSEKNKNLKIEMDKTMKKLVMILVVLGLVNIAAVSEATLAPLDVRVDFQKDGGAVPAAGHWNAIELSGYATTSGPLIDYTTGSATLVKTVGTNWGTYAAGLPWSPAGWVETAAATDGFAGSWASTQTFSGLNIPKNYKVEVVSAYRTMSTATLTINGSYADKNYDNTMTGDVSLNWDMLTALNNKDWMIWSSIAPNPDGKLVISLTTGGGWGILNAVRISEVPVPEPATMCLLGLGGLSLLRRKRSKA
jgi:hypothetical protein